MVGNDCSEFREVRPLAIELLLSNEFGSLAKALFGHPRLPAKVTEPRSVDLHIPRVPAFSLSRSFDVAVYGDMQKKSAHYSDWILLLQFV